ncbi:MAG: virulence RhuM family protein [Muribaculaceae bacterium]|nr:virulence RhuM family protein [Muribaculaceae bacterium]
MELSQENEIIVYQPDDTLKLSVQVEGDTVWLTQAQMIELFQTSRQNISLHISNIFKERELDKCSVVKDSLITAADGKRYKTKLYNLDVIISVGYRVKSLRGTQFRQWANTILKDYMLRGYAANQRMIQLEDRIDRRLSEHERHLIQLDEKIDFFVRSSLQPIEGVFYDGQIFDAFAFAANLIRKAGQRIVIVDNYVDESVLTQLSKRAPEVTVDIYTCNISNQLRLDVERHNSQYPGVTLHVCRKAHDRFLIIDEEVYHIGHSLKDLGKKIFAFSKLNHITGSELIIHL